MKTYAILSLLLLSFSIQLQSLADTESWNFVENKIKLTEKNEISPQINLRLLTRSFINTRSEGLGDLLFRFGPTIDILPWFNISMHGVLDAYKSSNKEFIQELRGEIDPTFFTSFGDFSFSDRNRFEFRTKNISNSLGYRNLLRINYNPQNSNITPFIYDEIFFDLLNSNISQNRAMIGLGIKINKNTKLDLGYMLRNRYVQNTSKWENDNVLVVNLQSDFTKF